MINTKELLFLAFFLIGTALVANGQAILNAEKLSPQRKEPLNLNFSGDVAAASGNTNFLNVETIGAFGYKSGRHWIRLLGGNEFLAEEGEPEVVNNWFGHLRYNHYWTRRLSSFNFLQIQKNQSLILQRRQIAGIGVRYAFFRNDTAFDFDLGTGVMYEDERLKANRLEQGEPDRTKEFRSTTIVVFRYQLDDQYKLIHTSYFQPALNELADYRILSELNFLISLNESLSLDLAVEWRYDNQPPGNLQNNDYSLEMGLVVDI